MFPAVHKHLGHVSRPVERDVPCAWIDPDRIEERSPRHRRVDDQERVGDLCVTHGVGECNERPDVVADDHRRSVTDYVFRYGTNVGCHRVLVVTAGWTWRAAYSPQIGGDDSEPIAQAVYYVAPLVPGLRETVQQDDRWPGAGRHIVHVDIVDAESVVT